MVFEFADYICGQLEFKTYNSYRMETSKIIGKLDAITLSNYILEKYSLMSHLKIQKILFYCEAYHLAYFDESLIDENFEAWVHGPVCREVFDSLKDKSILYSDLTYGGESVLPKVDAELISTQIQILNDVLGALSKWTDIELEDATHQEAPWIQARGTLGAGERCTNIISKPLMKTTYKSELGLS